MKINFFKYELVIRKKTVNEKQVIKYANKISKCYSYKSRIDMIREIRKFFDAKYPNSKGCEWLSLRYLNELTKSIILK